MTRQPLIAIAAGGTGGHLFPALAVAQELQASSAAEIVFFGTARGHEARIVPLKGYRLHKIWIKGYPRKLKWEILLLPLKFFVALLQSLYHLTKFWPDCLLATGGYVCLPVMLAAKLLGIPIIIHEQNSLPGITARIGARWAKSVFYSFDDSAKYFDYHPDAQLCGNPVSLEFSALTKQQALQNLGLDQSKKTLLVLGGSQGAASLNNAVKDKIELLAAKYNLIWGVGKGNLPENVPPGVLVKEFFDDMKTLYTASDLAVCRAGAMTLAELAACALPAILIPFPYAAEDHQRLNAQPLADDGAARLILDKEFNGKILLNTVEELFAQPHTLNDMSQKMNSFHRPQAGKIIARKILSIARHEI